MVACPEFNTSVWDTEQMRTVSAVARAADVLDVVAQASEPVRVSVIALGVGIPRNSAYELVYTLADRGLLRLRDDGRVSLGVRLFELGSRYAQSLDLLVEARIVAAGLRDESGETVHVAMLDGRHAIYLIKEESRQMVRMASATGMRLAAHVSAVGKAMLAALPADELRRRFDGVVLERLTPNSITTFEALVADLAETRRRGYALDHQESSPEVACVAAPLVSGDGLVVAAMSISLPIYRMTAGRERELATMVTNAVAALGTRLGYRTEGDRAAVAG
jgi:IclR family KDG regulon transcriptional repressor